MNRILPFLCLFPLVACGVSARVDSILALSGDATAGATVYENHCASCHGADGRGASGPGILGEEAEEVVDVVLYGEEDMPAFADTLEDQEIADVTAWVSEQG
jgi:mono/diheme cytochrome c family protein